MPVVAQTSNAESDRIPGLPEPSIGTSLPRRLADPGGVRSALAKRGVIFAVNYIGEVLGNPTGGYRQGAFYDGRLELAVQADLEKGIGWPGLSFFANGYQIHGDSISAAALGVLMPASFIEADPSTRLFELAGPIRSCGATGCRSASDSWRPIWSSYCRRAARPFSTTPGSGGAHRL